MKKYNFFNLILIFVLIISIVLLFFQNVNLFTGYVVSANVSSNVSVSKYLATSFSNDLSGGISFGSVEVLPVTNINATHNYGGASNGTKYTILVSEDGNTPVDFCIRADGAMTNIAADEIGLGNESYANSSSTNLTIPSVGLEVSLTTIYVKSGYNIPVGQNNSYRFWLDIPVAQPSGDYNNTIYFKGIQTSDSC